MLDETKRGDSAPALAAGVAGTGGETPFGVVLDRFVPAAARSRLAGLPAVLGVRAGVAALSSLVLGTLAIVVFASAGPSQLVSRSGAEFPGWEAGPLHNLFGHPSLPAPTLLLSYSLLILAMTVAYGAALLAARSLPMRTIAVAVVALNVVVLLGPPLQLTDLFNYLGYARLGGLHHLNPYTHVINAESLDPVYRFTTWHNLASPYGPLFTAASYPMSWLPLPVAYWLLKLGVVSASLAFVWLIWKCARLLGHDPRYAVLFVAANPLYVIFALGGFHNDFFMLVPSTAAMCLLLARRDRAAGAALAIAVAVKFTAIVLLPFLLIAARPPARRLRLLAGVGLAAIPLVALSVAAFGFTTANLADQSGLVTAFSVPNLLGLLLGLGGSTPPLLHLLNVGVAVVVLVCMRRPRQWVSGAGWATLALIASIAWLMPWYLVWVLPLAALGSSVRLRRVTLAFTVFLVLTFIPETGTLLSSQGINPMATPTGQAAVAFQARLQQ
jgi:Glycosyltransferase family 87